MDLWPFYGLKPYCITTTVDAFVWPSDIFQWFAGNPKSGPNSGFGLLRVSFQLGTWDIHDKADSACVRILQKDWHTGSFEDPGEALYEES